MRNSGYRVIALTAAIGAAAAVLALTTHRDSATDVAPAPVAPVAPAGTGVADPSSTPATTAGAAMSGATPSWPAGSIVITGSTGDGVTVLDPTGAARQDIHETDPVTVLVPAAFTAHAGSIQLADQTTGQVSTADPAGGTIAQSTIGGSPIRGGAAGDRTPREGHTIWLDAASGSAVILDPTGAVQSVVKVGSNPAQVIIAPAGTPRAGTAYVLNQGNGQPRGRHPLPRRRRRDTDPR